MEIDVKQFWKRPFWGNLPALMSRFLCLIVILSVACFWVARYYTGEQRRKFREVMGDLLILDAGKRNAALCDRMTNGYAFTLQDLKGFIAADMMEALEPYVGKELPGGKLVHSENCERVYILNPVGVPAKVRFLHDFAGHPAGSEIKASVAEIMTDLERINFAKEEIARANNWRTGHPVTFDDIYATPGMPGLTNEYDGKVLFVLNPVGAPVKARVVKAWDGLPIGFEISSDDE